jgi:hypothetical protein
MGAVQKPLTADGMEPFGSAYPTSDAYPTEGGVFKIDAPNALPTPCDMVSIATTKEDIPKRPRNWGSGVENLPNDNLNQPY